MSEAVVLALPHRSGQRRRLERQLSGLPFGAQTRPGPEDPTATVQLQAMMFPERALGEGPMTPAKVRRIRTELALSQTQFGHLLNASTVTVHRWESGRAAPNPWVTEVLQGIGLVLDGHTVADTVRLSLVYRGAVQTLHDLLSFVYVKE